MKNKKTLSVVLIGSMVLACTMMSMLPAKASTKTIKNLVVKSTDDSHHEIKAVKNKHVYTIDTTHAVLRKSKSGSIVLAFSEIKRGDVLNVTGSEDSNHDVTATLIRDLSVTKKATFYGIVKKISDSSQTVKIKTLKRGRLTVFILGSTKITYDKNKRTFDDIRIGDKVLVTGTWSHSKKKITKTKKFDILVRKDYPNLN